MGGAMCGGLRATRGFMTGLTVRVTAAWSRLCLGVGTPA